MLWGTSFLQTLKKITLITLLDPYDASKAERGWWYVSIKSRLKAKITGLFLVLIPRIQGELLIWSADSRGRLSKGEREQRSQVS